MADFETIKRKTRDGVDSITFHRVSAGEALKRISAAPVSLCYVSHQFNYDDCEPNSQHGCICPLNPSPRRVTLLGPTFVSPSPFSDKTINVRTPILEGIAGFISRLYRVNPASSDAWRARSDARWALVSGRS
jgi:hypothetical protein